MNEKRVASCSTYLVVKNIDSLSMYCTCMHCTLWYRRLTSHTFRSTDLAPWYNYLSHLWNFKHICDQSGPTAQHCLHHCTGITRLLIHLHITVELKATPELRTKFISGGSFQEVVTEISGQYSVVQKTRSWGWGHTVLTTHSTLYLHHCFLQRLCTIHGWIRLAALSKVTSGHCWVLLYMTEQGEGCNGNLLSSPQSMGSDILPNISNSSIFITVFTSVVVCV